MHRSAIRTGVILAVLSLGVTILTVFHLAAQSKPHSVALSWNAPQPAKGITVAGYNVYRGTASGGPYVKIALRVPGLTYTDRTVVSGKTYFYVVTAVGQGSRDSRVSQEIKAVIP